LRINRSTKILTGHAFKGFINPHIARFETEKGLIEVTADYFILAFGGASWPRLGSNGDFVPAVEALGVDITPFKPSNMGFLVDLPQSFYQKFAGTPLKKIALTFKNYTKIGDLMVTKDGFEGGVIYALSASIREALERHTPQTLSLDLKPDVTLKTITEKLRRPKGKASLSTYLKKTLNLCPCAISLLSTLTQKTGKDISPEIIKALPCVLLAPKGLERAISSAGGVQWDFLTPNYALKKYEHIYCIGEMIDWEAPTGGYLLQACFSMAYVCAHDLIRRLGLSPKSLVMQKTVIH
jgi:uncharacterized flavoprotein (TIGR03862 family)